ncbi:hypothetical protein OIU78_016267 [Salix suchowensis]|nr:hypothetical protein OIU78_016267 [Salix suchowensis]
MGGQLEDKDGPDLSSIRQRVQFSTSESSHGLQVPGNGGNQLEARLTRGYKPSSLFCHWYPIVKQKGGWFRLWFDAGVLLAPFTQCFADRMTLFYDKDLDDYRNAPGVETRVLHFGSTQSLLYLDPNLKRATAYMAPLVESFRRNWIWHPSKVGSKFLQDLKDLVEKASRNNGGKPVILVSHSLGGLFVLQLLNKNPLSWRRKYIKHFVAISAPWGGTVEEMTTFASGYTLGVPFVDPLLVREEQRTSESNSWLLPTAKVFGERKLVITPNATYSAHEITQFLNDIGFSRGVYPYTTRILPLTEQLIAPEVPITCMVGSGVRTPETLFYGENGFDEQPDVVYGDGDGHGKHGKPTSTGEILGRGEKSSPQDN